MPFGTVIISIWGHRNSGSADRSVVFINAYVVMDFLGMAAFAVKVDQCTYIPDLEKLVRLSIAELRHIFFKERPGIFFPGSWKATRKETELWRLALVKRSSALFLFA